MKPLELPYTCGHCGKKHFNHEWSKYNVCSEECDLKSSIAVDIEQEELH